ncbi:hypothetical protein RHCRD62_50283 [Rhodococcus sp. RD6.2]|nr:hypothetical protein RHCRD62_50283 [Rhodococcus sp. RD6.2]
MKLESSAIPSRAADSAHWCLRCSVGATTVIWSTVRSPSNSAATRRAKVVLPAPGVATARKSRGLVARYFVRARRCQARRLGAGADDADAALVVSDSVSPMSTVASAPSRLRVDLDRDNCRTSLTLTTDVLRIPRRASPSPLRAVTRTVPCWSDVTGGVVRHDTSGAAERHAVRDA